MKKMTKKQIIDSLSKKYYTIQNEMIEESRLRLSSEIESCKMYNYKLGQLRGAREALELLDPVFWNESEGKKCNF
jgi:hypothetical protein